MGRAADPSDPGPRGLSWPLPRGFSPMPAGTLWTRMRQGLSQKSLCCLRSRGNPTIMAPSPAAGPHGQAGDGLACLKSMPHDIPGEQPASGHSATRRAYTLTNQTSQPRRCLPPCRPGAHGRDSGFLFVPLAPITHRCPRQAQVPTSPVLQVTLLYGSPCLSSSPQSTQHPPSPVGILWLLPPAPWHLPP